MQQYRKIIIIAIDTLNTELAEVIQQDILHRRVNGIDKGSLITALYQIGIIAGAIREGNKGIEKAPIPVDSADVIDIFLYFSGFHISSFTAVVTCQNYCLNTHPRHILNHYSNKDATVKKRMIG